jgi:hypothetical protein
MSTKSSISKWKDGLLVAFLLVFLLLGAGYALLFWENNRSAPPYEVIRLEKSLDSAIRWIENNEEHLSDNSILWWMIRESGRLTGRSKLIEFSNGYEASYFDAKPENGWALLFRPQYRGLPVSPEAVAPLEDYQKLFIYGLTCDAKLGRLDSVRDQFDPEFCTNHFLHPRCVTHQVMGLRFAQRNECGDSEEVALLISQLQAVLAFELTWDPRVGDAYIQRVLMLVESSADNLVKPIWIQQILDAQNTDGGWGDLAPILRLPGNRALGFTSKLPTVAALDSDFHATAQGIWLVSLLLISHDGS